MVEAATLGRECVGSDISSLAVFVAEAKTTPLDDAQVQSILSWADSLLPLLTIRCHAERARSWAASGYQRNISDRTTWRIRKLLEIALAKTEVLQGGKVQRFARCILLNTAQWALDCRDDVPSVFEFRHRLLAHTRDMLSSMNQYARAVAAASASNPTPICLCRSAIGIEHESAFPRHRPVSLILTSPPYPGVHVLYHRWQIRGRKETAAPFWIANSVDGAGESHYTFGSRKRPRLDSYFDQALAAFKSIGKVCCADTLVVQMLSFSDPSWQLPQYLRVMRHAGFDEVFVPMLNTRADDRAWRPVPNRKWYASRQVSNPSSKEVVLFHKLRA